MIDRILRNFAASEYDFRPGANPDDPLGRFFPAWVDYYRMKAAIARTLQAKTILEIGVRYGYGAAAFLHGSPEAHYTGIDLDSDAFGGVKGALAWARAHLPAKQCELLAADTQRMDRLPGDRYDLIHVDGQQDGDGTAHDMELALRQGNFVLVDGYLWTERNFLAASDFVFRNKALIEYYVVIPGYAGELLIKTRALAPDDRNPSAASAAIRQHYDASYYLRDCGGWDSFDVGGTGELADQRLRSVLDLALFRSPRRLLDLGCGRGEVVLQAARQEIAVTAVDYSSDAITLARTAAEGAGAAVRERINFVCADATTVQADVPVDIAVASDLIEHLGPEELDRLYASVARQLAPGGQFILHTFPNRWYYDYDYPRRRRQASALGAYLPAEPRSYFEKLMHINEQSPAKMRRQLQRHFPHVLLWFSDGSNPTGSLGQRHAPRELAGMRDLYAIASRQPLDPAALLAAFANDPISDEDATHLVLTTAVSSLTLAPGAATRVDLTLANHSARTLHSFGPRPVHLSYHILHASDGRVAKFEGHRSRLTPNAPPQSRRLYRPLMVAPDEPGRYLVQFTLVQESVRWLGDARPAIRAELPLTVCR